ncbi:MAG: DUF1499 domain-containing protein [Oscillatoriales cyanobacterium SM2_2_1]|nr:DUF1499 domain-containing protein [Oscillatoriales cyanobacterium SM2_2_1]
MKNWQMFGFVGAAVVLGVLYWLVAMPGAEASLFSFSGTRPNTLGISQGHLRDCPSSPNCVSSQSFDPEHMIAPLAVPQPQRAIADLETILQGMERTKIVTKDDRYLYAEFASAIMGFVDDVEFFYNANQGWVEVRSASRLGESDLGVNRQRIETVRSRFRELQSKG